MQAPDLYVPAAKARQTRVIIDVAITTLQPLTYTTHSAKDEEQLITLRVDPEDENAPRETVHIPGRQLRGVLRKEGAMALMRTVPQKAKLGEAYLLALGQAIGGDSEAANSGVTNLSEQKVFREASPFLDLFGTWKLKSKLSVSDLTPVGANVMPFLVRGLRRDLDSDPSLVDHLADGEIDELYARKERQDRASALGRQLNVANRRKKKAEREKEPAEVIQELAELIARLEAEKEAVKGDDKSSNTAHLLSYPAIPSGLALAGRMVLDRPTTFDLNALMAGFDGLSQKPVMGAQAARGCGEIKGTATFRTPSGEVLARVTFGGFEPCKPEWTEAGLEFAAAHPGKPFLLDLSSLTPPAPPEKGTKPRKNAKASAAAAAASTSAEPQDAGDGSGADAE